MSLKHVFKIAEKNSDRDENKERGYWDRPVEFTLTIIGYTVGIGNLWRFPYLCARNGGLAFFIPYVFFVFLCGYPLMFLEFFLGQFSSLSTPKVWKVSPLFQVEFCVFFSPILMYTLFGIDQYVKNTKNVLTIITTGLGYGVMIDFFSGNIYITVLMAWVLYYLVESFKSRLPWASCDNSWNTATCVSTLQEQLNITTRNVTGVLPVNGSSLTITSGSTRQNMLGHHLTSTAEFWQYRVLDISTGFSDLGSINWRLLLALAACWFIVFLIHIRGIKSSGKVVYITALAPYFFLTVFLIRGLLLPGATEGILYFLTPDFSRLLDYRVWNEACVQMFYSLSVATGGLLTMSSYNKFHNNFYRDALIVTAADTFTSFYAGLVLYTILGFMAHKAQISLSQLSTYGPALLFVVYPEIFSQLPLPQLWSVLFFLMLMTVCLDTQFVTFENLVTGLTDWFPNKLRHRKTKLTAFLAVLCFLQGIPYVTQAGMFLLQIADWYILSLGPFVIGISECTIILWIYGHKRLSSDIQLMLGRKPPAFIRITLAFITPLIILVVFLFTLVTYEAPSYGNYIYPAGAIALGWCFAVSLIVPFPVVALYKIIKQRGTITERIKIQVKADQTWGPALEDNRNERPLIDDPEETFSDKLKLNLFGRGKST